MNSDVAARRTNRRFTARVACHLTVHYKAISQWHPAIAVNLSNQGCRLRLGEDLAIGTPVGVRFEQAPNGESPVHRAQVEGKVMWCHHEGLSYQVGIHFDAGDAALDEILSSVS